MKEADRKESRHLLKERGATRLSIVEHALLGHLVTDAWARNNQKRPIKTSAATYIDRVGLKGVSESTIRRAFEKLETEGLISIHRVKRPVEYTVHVEPMREWETNQEMKEAKREKLREDKRTAAAHTRQRKAEESNKAQDALSTLIAYAVCSGALPESVFETATA